MCVRLTHNKKMGVDSGTIQNIFEMPLLWACVCNFPLKPVHCLSFKIQHFFLPWSQRSTCFCLWSDGIKGVWHHCLASNTIFYRSISLVLCVLWGVCMCSTCVLGACGSQKRVLDPLEPELQLLWTTTCWELKPGPLQEEKELLTAELSCPICYDFSVFFPPENYLDVSILKVSLRL